MQTQEVAIKPNLKVGLKPDTEVLDEVVLTGYGNFKKSSLKIVWQVLLPVFKSLLLPVSPAPLPLCVFAVWGLSMPAMNHYMSLTECPC